MVGTRLAVEDAVEYHVQSTPRELLWELAASRAINKAVSN